VGFVLDKVTLDRILSRQFGLTISKTPLVWINWESDPSEYAENQDNWIFL
jgi:hypothetical protein